jgi:hypothetical protein
MSCHVNPNFNLKFQIYELLLVAVGRKQKFKKRNLGLLGRIFSLLPNLLRKLRSSSMELVVLVYSPLASSKILPLLGKRQCKLHRRCIFLDKIQMLCLSSILLPVLLSVHLGQERYKFLHIAHSQCSVAH